MRRRLLGLLLLSQLGGCAFVASVSGNLDQRVDEWVAKQEYGLALDALGYVKPGDPDYKRLMAKRETVLAKARAYEQVTLRKANQQADDGDWGAALETVETGQAHLPDSKVLRDGRADLLQRQTRRLGELNVDLLVARGEALLRLLPVYGEIARVDARGWQAARSLAGVRQEAAEVAAELTRRGSTALARKELNVARRTLPLALRLAPTPEAKQANQQLLLQLGPNPRKEGARDEESRDLLQHYQQAFHTKNWAEAQRLLALLELQPSPPPELAQLRNELNDQVANAVHHFVERGVTLYSRGKYEEALAVWRQAAAIDPDNERVNSHIARAERVLEKLNALKEKSTHE